LSASGVADRHRRPAAVADEVKAGFEGGLREDPDERIPPFGKRRLADRSQVDDAQLIRAKPQGSEIMRHAVAAITLIAIDKGQRLSC
jgi:hypothetical protein